MTAAGRACALVGNMLAAGPRDAAEILAAAEGAKISRRTIQRSAAVLGVVKVKEGLAAGWSWSLAPKRPAASGRVASIDPARAETIAARLRKLEAGRGKVAPIYAGDPRVKQWADSGISDPAMREAYERAVYDLQRARSQAPVTAGFLDRYVMQEVANTGGN